MADRILTFANGEIFAVPIYGRKNFIINGMAQINQRVTAFTLAKDTYGICADRFFGMATGTAVSAGTFTRATAAPCGRTGLGFHLSGVTLTGTGILYLRHRIEAADALLFKNQKASFSCKIYHDVGSAINYTVYIRKANAADGFSAVTNISNSGGQSKASATELDLKYENISMGDCSNGIEIEIKVECGAVTTKNFYFTELQFEPGSSATPFEYRTKAEQLALCHRYYDKSYDLDTAPGTATHYGGHGAVGADGSHGEVTRVQFSVRKRTPPTVVLYSSHTGASGAIYNSAGATDVAATAIFIGDGGFPNPGVGLAHGATYIWHWTANAEL